ncbi:hypothetical protein QBC34DRAFT_420538 [Podospora aff. communis PSN243]|uniref:Uncharacterized protein n=1 Tax=Podospora aff. communis PSN243 TaxID=3040156 RepID=A0AAV9H231_9PEZI|nr:hypothetical protein QBC34DRAFT_420538 [Podospora aff. communis PSN243]
MHPKHLPALLLTTALATYAFPLDTPTTQPDDQPGPPATWCPTNTTMISAPACQGPVFYCYYYMIFIGVGGCVQDESGVWVPFRKWTIGEVADHLMTGSVPNP